MAKKANPGKNTTTKGKAPNKSRESKPLGKTALSAKKKGGAKKTPVATNVATRASSPKKVRPKILMSPDELDFFRRKLLEKRREIIGDMNGIEAEALGSDRQEAAGDISDHPADAGTDNFEQEFSLGLLESERQILGEINEALTRIDDGSYGTCLGTGKPIGKGRLEARPWSKYCIDYARLIEKGLVQPGDSVEDEDGEDDDDDHEVEHEADLDPDADNDSDSDNESESEPDTDD